MPTCSSIMLWKLALIATLAIDVSGNDTTLEKPASEAKQPTTEPRQKKDNETETKFVLTDAHRKEIKTLVTAVCTNSSQADKSEGVNDAILKFINCSQSLFDLFAIKDSVLAAKKNGTHGKVIKKYCKKSEGLKRCIHKLTPGVSPCVPQNLKEYYAHVDNATDSLIDFLCAHKGKRIADFMTDNGIDCFHDKFESITGCAKSLKSRRTENMPIPAMCKLYDELSECVVRVVEACPGRGPSKIAEALLVHMRNAATDCPKLEEATMEPEINDQDDPDPEQDNLDPEQDDLDPEQQNKAESRKKTLLRIGEL